MGETIELLKQKISSLEMENSELRGKVEYWKSKYDECDIERSHYEHETAALEQPLLSQQTNSSEYVPSGYNDFYKMIFVLGLRSYVKNAKNIEKVMEIMALYFAHMCFDMT
eukprot:236029_1